VTTAYVFGRPRMAVALTCVIVFRRTWRRGWRYPHRITLTYDYAVSARRLPPWAALLAVLGLSFCSGETPRPTSPRASDAPLASEAGTAGQVSTITVQATTTGANPDPDGYEFTVALSPSSVAPNCSVTGANQQTVSVAPGGTVTATFAVTCSEVFGNITVTTATTGSDLDPDGYTATVDDNAAAAQPVAVNGSVTFSNLSAGSHTIALSGLATNCSTTENPRTVTVTSGQTTSAAFAIACQAVHTTGDLTVTTTTTGSDLDPDGYTVSVDGGVSKAVGVNGSVKFSDLSAGSHVVALSGLAANCTTADSPKTVTVTAGATVIASMSVACQALPAPEVGDLAVTTTTTGSNLDPDGYTVTVDENAATTKSIGVNGSVTFAGLGAGSHTVALSGLAANCMVSGPNPQTVVVVNGGMVTSAFSVSCQALVGNLTVNVTTRGTELDTDGYSVTVDGTASQAVGVNGSVTFTDLGTGSHTVALSGLAVTCSTLGSPRTVSVTAGQTTQTAIAVECTTLYTFVGAGNIGGCTWDSDEATAKLLDAVIASDPRATVFVTGDNAYDEGTAAELANCFAPTWGRHKSRMYAALGNHDYRTDPNPSWDYFGDRAGPRGQGYFSFDLGDYWHIIILNDNWGDGGPAGSAGSTQDKWLQADLAANTKPCTIAIWHQPYVASGWSILASRKNFWTRLYDAGAELVINSHAHFYERFAPQTPDLVRDDARGLRAFVIGTGGIPPSGIVTTRRANSETGKGNNGVLRLTLGARTYRWEFIPVAGKTYTDSGSGTCH
jgi:hypothetical protein